MALPTMPSSTGGHPTVMGVLYLAGTVYPTAKKLGTGVVLFNRATGTLAPADDRGYVILDEGGDYVPERADSERLRKLTEDSRTRNRRWSKVTGTLARAAARRAASPNNHTPGGIGTIGRGLNRLTMLGFSNPNILATSNSGDTSPSPGDGPLITPLVPASANGGTESPGLNLFGTIRGRRRSSEESAQSSPSPSGTSPVVQFAARTFGTIGRLGSAGKSVSATELGASRSRSGSAGSSTSPSPSSHVRDAVYRRHSHAAGDHEIREGAGSPPPQVTVSDLSIHSADSGGIPTSRLDEEDEDGDQHSHRATVSFDDIVQTHRPPPFAITGSESFGSMSSGPLPLNGFHTISEEEMADPSPVPSIYLPLEMHMHLDPTSSRRSAKSASNRSLPQQRLLVWVALEGQQLVLYTDETKSEIVESIYLSENCLALLDESNLGQESFYVVEDDHSLRLHTRSKDDALHWMSRINSTALTAFLRDDLNGGDGVSGNGSDYRKEYEELVKSFDLVELSRVPVPDLVDPSDAASRVSILVTQPTLMRRSMSIMDPPAAHARDAGSDTASIASAEIHSPIILSPTPPDAPESMDRLLSGSSTRGLVPSNSTVSNVSCDGSLSPLSETGSRTSSTKLPCSLPRKSSTGSADVPMLTIPTETPLAPLPVPSNLVTPTVIYDHPEPSSPAKPDRDAGSPQKNRIAAATLDKLVERLSDPFTFDPVYVDRFLLGYRHFSDATTILHKITARLVAVPPSDATQADAQFVQRWRPVIRMRLLTVVKMWLNRYWLDFQHSDLARAALGDLLYLLAHWEPDQWDGPAGNEHRACLARVGKLLGKLAAFQTEAYPAVLAAVVPEPKPERVLPPCDFLEMDPRHVAIQLTVNEFKRFRAVRPIECLLHLWGDTKNPGVQAEIRDLTEMIWWSNQVSYWVATEICTQPELPNRVKVLERMIKIAKICRRERNFNTTMAIIAGLNNSGVLRLKQTWEAMQDKYKQRYADLEQLMAQTHNFRQYRAVIDSMEHDGFRHPFVPFMGLFLKDLMFWNENPKMHGNGLINFGKIRAITGLVQQLHAWQELEYRPPLPIADVVVRYCKHLRALKDDTIYKYSNLCERRAGAGESMRLIDKWRSDDGSGGSPSKGGSGTISGVKRGAVA
ncbi:hypothetical protein AMAG_12386 [Allomyces macrogynus ATCC 38327]|uniref:Ras GEF n=1 Tax=Allomyces macrogynus (strain ATCC 38327) TaxID=578462 RepID=A0A0L0SYS2_ALLM3|nr:hypothetical protein AMAG_12386 [Allomyces macrogynus ATCC 38327]|eukprot:KNE67651.1 hypothetical protein AMAG_12386 [Allomyces macrogynus ATCC 38327]